MKISLIFSFHAKDFRKNLWGIKKFICIYLNLKRAFVKCVLYMRIRHKNVVLHFLLYNAGRINVKYLVGWSMVSPYPLPNDASTLIQPFYPINTP